jgi:hypothetical protein
VLLAQSATESRNIDSSELVSSSSMSRLPSQFDPELDYYPPSLRRKHGLKEFVPNENLITGATSADIGWIPDFAKFRERTATRSQTDRFDDILPEGWPRLLDHPLVWSGDDLQKEQYVYELSPSQKLEIHSALSRLKGTCLSNVLVPDNPKSCSLLSTICRSRHRP